MCLDGRLKNRGVVSAIVAIAMVVMALDLLAKWLVEQWIGPGADAHAWWLVDATIGFEYGRNSGAAFGMFSGNAELLAAMALVISLGFVWLIMAEVASTPLAIAASGLLVGGALGNMAERVFLGYVTDFVAVGPWPRFNVADSAITVGVVAFVVGLLMSGPAHDDSTTEGDVQQDG